MMIKALDLSSKRFIVFIVFMAGMLGGCETLGVNSRVIMDGQPALTRGPIYYLPEGVMEIEAQVTARRAYTVLEGVEIRRPDADEILILDPVKVTPIVRPDQNWPIVLSGDALSDSKVLTTTLNYQIADNGLLTGVSSDIEDKTLDAVKSYVSSGISIAKLVLTAASEDLQQGLTARHGDDAAKKLITLIDKRNKLYDQLLSLGDFEGEAQPDDKQQIGIKAQIDLIDKLIEQIKTENIALKYKEEKKSIKLIAKPYLDGYRHTVGPGLFPDITLEEPEFYPSIETVFSIDERAIRRSDPSSYPASATGWAASGVLVRAPYETLVRLLVANSPRTAEDRFEVEVWEGYVNFPQFSQVSSIPLQSKARTTRNSELKMSSVGGGMSTYKVTSESSADKTAAVLEDSVGKLSTLVGDLRSQSSTTAATEALSQEKEFIEAKIELEKVRQELEELNKKQKDNNIQNSDGNLAG